MQQDMNCEQTELNEQQTEEQMVEGNGLEVLDDDTEDDRKLFVGGVSWGTTAKELREYFEKFGKVVNCTLKTDYSTQKSRGFGFVCFASEDSVKKVMDQGNHELNGRKLDPKKATPRAKKIFVGKLDQTVTEDEVKEYFSKFGEVEKMEFPFDKNKDSRRAFCFVEFKKMSSFKKCLEETNHKIKDKEVDVKKATLPQGGNQRGGPRGGRGGPGQMGRGGRGGYQGPYGGGGFGNYYPGYYDPNDYYNQGYGGYDPYYNGYYPGWQGAGYNQGYGGYGYDHM